jgi:cytochrome c-type biogenesis protein CcmH/NrfG
MNERNRNYLSQARRLIEIDTSLAKETDSPEKEQEIRAELSELFKKLHSRTGDPFYLYRIGQNYMIMKNMPEARRYFAQAYEAAPDYAYYKEPAKKLAETLH